MDKIRTNSDIAQTPTLSPYTQPYVAKSTIIASMTTLYVPQKLVVQHITRIFLI